MKEVVEQEWKKGKTRMKEGKNKNERSDKARIDEVVK